MPHIDGIEEISEIIKGKQKDRLDKFKLLKNALKEQSDIVMTNIARLLLEEKRGVYRNMVK